MPTPFPVGREKVGMASVMHLEQVRLCDYSSTCNAK